MSVWAQYPSELVGFNDSPDDPNSHEMFQIPQFSGSTSEYVVQNVNPYDNNNAFRASGMQTEGVAALRVFFSWVDSLDPDAWVRLTTYDGNVRPNPSLHTQGQVRFKLVNRSEFVQGEFGICLGIRETGVDVPQLADGGTSGPIEWVGVDTTINGITAGADHIVDTAASGDDVQEYPVGTNLDDLGLPDGTAVISPGPNGMIDSTPAGDDEYRFGYFIGENGGRVPIPAITLPVSESPLDPYVLEWDLSTGVVYLGGVPQGGGIASFYGGNGVLDAPNDRGTLEHVAITNLTTDGAIFIDFAIDELQFEAPEPDPVLPPTIVSPILPGDIEVTVTDLMFTADQAELYLDGDLLQTQDVSWPDDAVFTIDPAEVDDVYTARQHDSTTDTWSDFSEPVIVTMPTISEWIETSPLPMGLTGHQLVELSAYIYCVGGRSDDSQSAVDTVYYAPVNGDGSIGAWAAATSLPQELACHGAAVYDGRVYVWGGWTFGYPTVNTCYYADQNPDGSLGAWVTSAVTIPDNTDVDPQGTQMDAFGRGDMIYNGVLYIINGEWDNGLPGGYGNTNNCYYSTITAGGDFSPWIETTPTETVNGSWFHGVAVIEGSTETYMYRVAGNYRGTYEWDMYRTTIQPDGSLSPWVEEPLHLPEGRYEIACASANNKWVFVICGLYGATPQNTVYYTEVDPDTGAFLGWIEGPPYPETVSRNAAVTYSVNGTTYLLVAGGGPYSGPQRTPRCFYAEVHEEEVVCPADVDGDGDTDLSDLAMLLAAYGSVPGAPNWNPACDFDGDSDVDLTDLAFLLADYGCGG